VPAWVRAKLAGSRAGLLPVETVLALRPAAGRIGNSRASIPPVKGTPSSPASAEAVRAWRLRDDARRPASVNLAETIALSHKLMGFEGAARRDRRT
jgi:hypothetical protein